MLRGTQLTGFSNFAGRSLISIIRRNGLTTGLLFALDAGDKASYSGSGQVWSDVSGAGNHFNRGVDDTATSSDPTFNGTAGNLSESEYFSGDGGDYFSLASGTFDDGWSKNNGAFTVLIVAGNASFTASPNLMGNASAASGIDGFTIEFTATTKTIGLSIDRTDAGGTTAVVSTATATNSVPNLIIFGHDEATTTTRLKLNAIALEAPVFGASTLTNNAGTLNLLAKGDGNTPATSGTKIWMAAAWDHLMPATSVEALAHDLRKLRFPSMP